MLLDAYHPKKQRPIASGKMVHVTISPRLLIGVFYVLMILVLAERREELATLVKPELHRKPFKHYNIRPIDKTILALSINTYTGLLFALHFPLSVFE